MPKVSVIVPVYNVEKFLNRCVLSLRKQTLEDIEIILVDDQSPDNCPQMCDEYAKLDHRIKVIHKNNEGLGYARNSGLEIATGEYIAFVDSDDYVDLEMLESMYNAAIKENADFVRVDNYRELIDGTILNKNYVPPTREGVYDQEELREEILYPQLGMKPSETGDKYVSCSACKNIYRKELIDQLGVRFVSERELISEDLIFNVDFMMSCERAVVINRKYYHYIVNDKSLTQSYRADRFERELILYHALIDKTEKFNIYNECELRLYRHLLARLKMCIRSELIGNKDRVKGLRNVKELLNNYEVKSILKKYPISNMPLKYRIVTICFKYKMVGILWLIKNRL